MSVSEKVKQIIVEQLGVDEGQVDSTASFVDDLGALVLVRLPDAERRAESVERLRRACVDVLTEWTERLRADTGDGWPEKVTAFREGMAVHGRYGKPCPVCGAPVQRIVYAANEANYCVNCQTGGRLLADRSLSRLLREDWPRTLDELEQRKRGG
jgi:hypothetical protein